MQAARKNNIICCKLTTGNVNVCSSRPSFGLENITVLPMNKITVTRCRNSLPLRACCLRQVSCYITSDVAKLKQILTTWTTTQDRSSVSVVQRLYIFTYTIAINSFVIQSRMYIADVAYRCTVSTPTVQSLMMVIPDGKKSPAGQLFKKCTDLYFWPIKFLYYNFKTFHWIILHRLIASHF